MPEAPGAATVTDEQLVGLARLGDRSAQEELFRRHWAVAHRVAFRLLGHEQDAQDATQEGMIKALGHLGEFDGRSGFRTWLLRIVTNAAFDSGRKRKRRPSLGLGAPDGDADGFEPATTADPSLDLRRQDLRTILDAALARISPKQRQTFVLFAEGGLTYEEIAEIQQVPIGTVMSRIYYARTKLQSYLDGSRRFADVRSFTPPQAGPPGRVFPCDRPCFPTFPPRLPHQDPRQPPGRGSISVWAATRPAAPSPDVLDALWAHADGGAGPDRRRSTRQRAPSSSIEFARARGSARRHHGEWRGWAWRQAAVALLAVGIGLRGRGVAPDPTVVVAGDRPPVVKSESDRASWPQIPRWSPAPLHRRGTIVVRTWIKRLVVRIDDDGQRVVLLDQAPTFPAMPENTPHEF